ncbi:histidinol-phosphate transaminase [Neomegalonema sp.]|uniref:histidinol-phosphate transaminase n=1 Tax=Neomegalonema sp. TaxID=2039713 RepID=UPI002603D0FC|nr:histidinol-phosphate transaminase [Neomegalonema sp.]MDD2868789.1 histidinol-phosphate transaminase [Neomegalonema sp.]
MTQNHGNVNQGASGPQPKPGVLRIHAYVAGAAQTRNGKPAVKLSANENPLGASPAAKAAYEDAARNLPIYPDGSARLLREAIAEVEGLDPARILCGLGSGEILSLLAKAYAGEGDEVIYAEHGFSLYPISALAAGADPVVARTTGLRADVDKILDLCTPRTKLVFLDNPNNPTGTYLPVAEVERLRAGLPAQTLLVVDEAYAEFAEAGDFGSMLKAVETREDLVVTRTFSKIHGLAGLRVGWGYMPLAVADALHRIRGPFNVSIPAQVAGAAAIRDKAHVEASRNHVLRWRSWLAQALGGIGMEVTPSQANFLLLRFDPEGPRSAPAADAWLQERGYILRRMEGYGLPDRLRLSIGREEDNRAVVEALAQFMTENHQ